MTAPSPKVTLTPEIYAYFAAYYEKNPAWGIYHVSLEDGNFKRGVALDEWLPEMFREITDEDRRMRELFNQMTPSQRARIKKRCSR